MWTMDEWMMNGTNTRFGDCGRSMMTTYNLYIPGAYENFAEQATEVEMGMGG